MTAFAVVSGFELSFRLVLVFTFKSNTDFWKKGRGFSFFWFWQAHLCCSWTRFVSVHNETHLWWILFFGDHTPPLAWGYDWHQSWNAPTPTGSQCWYDWFILICINVFCCECNRIFFLMWQRYVWDCQTIWLYSIKWNHRGQCEMYTSKNAFAKTLNVFGTITWQI